MTQIDLNEQQRRVLSALRLRGTRGITVRDFDPSKGGEVIDGGPEFTRTHARVEELRKKGFQITTVRERPFSRYVLTGFPDPELPVVRRLAHGWIRTHYCRPCDFYGRRPCGPVCPTCGQPARATVELDARPAAAIDDERRAA